MLISSVLRILGTPEVPRKATRTDPEEKFPEVASKDASPGSTASGSIEAELLAKPTAHILRPLLPDPSLIFTSGVNPDYAKYLRALEKQAAKGESHTVDLFE